MLARSCGWTTATPDDLFDFFCYLATQGKGIKMVHETFCPGVGRAGEGVGLRRVLLRLTVPDRISPKGLVSKAKIGVKSAPKRAEMGPRPQRRQPMFEVISRLLSYHRVGVNQAARMLKHTLIHPLSDMRSRVQVVDSSTEPILLTKYVALYRWRCLRCIGVTTSLLLHFGRKS